MLSSCRDDSLEDIPYSPTDYTVLGQDVLGEMFIPEDNPMTEEGLRLGQHLFYDPILSVDSTISCSSCHLPEKAFTDGSAMSKGVNGALGTRSSMSLINLGYNLNGFFWNGRAATLEEQALHPVIDELEMNNTWENVEETLEKHSKYPEMFRKAFGINKKSEITKELVGKALAQFQRAITSYNSKTDQVDAGADVYTDEELKGKELFFEINLLEVKDAQCGHCHGDKPFTSNDYFNNGLQVYTPENGVPHKGRMIVTGNPIDMGKFRAPTLRNIMLTAPYMHDGRLKNIDEVIEHYNSGGHYAPNKDPNIVPLNLTDEEKEAIKAYLHTLTDTSYLQNPYLINPYK